MFSSRKSTRRRKRSRALCAQDLSPLVQTQLRELAKKAPSRKLVTTVEGETIDLSPKRRRGKYNVAPPEERTVDGIVFASKFEMKAYLRFKKAFGPNGFKRQVRYVLLETQNPDTGRKETIRYFADFEFRRGSKVFTVDTKGVETTDFKLKMKMFHAKTKRNIILLKTLSEVSVFIDELLETAA